MVLEFRTASKERELRREFHADRCIVGSSDKAQVQFPDESLEKFHAEFVRTLSGVYVRPLDGTFCLNGSESGEAWIHPGDQVVVGSVKIRVADCGSLPWSLDDRESHQSREAGVKPRTADSTFDLSQGSPDSMAPLVAEPASSPPDQDPATTSNAPEAHPLLDATASRSQSTKDSESNAEAPDTDPTGTELSDPQPISQPSEERQPAQPGDEPSNVSNSNFQRSTPSESVADVLARMRESGQLDTDLPDESEPVATPEIPATEASEGNAPPTPSEESGRDDESVQDYMKQLMQRLRGNPVDASVATVANSPETRTAGESATRHNEGQGDPVKPLDVSEYKPGKAAPEKSATLSALRQVANLSVESAIQTSTKAQLQQASLMYLGGAGACLCLSSVLFMFSGGMFDIAFISGCVFAVLCVLAVFKFLTLSTAKERQIKKDAKLREGKIAQAAESFNQPSDTPAANENEPVQANVG